MKTGLMAAGIIMVSVSLFLIIALMGLENGSNPVGWWKIRISSEEAGEIHFIGPMAESYTWNEQLLKLVGPGKVEKTLLLAADSHDSGGDEEGEDAGDEPADKDSEKDSNRFWGAPELG